MSAKGYRTAVLACVRKIRCWKNRCRNGTSLDGLGVDDGEQQRALQPAFRDTSTGIIYPSCFTDGRPAPMHILDGLPSSAVLARSPDGRVVAVKQSVEAGFSRGGRFYTREEAVAICPCSQPHAPFVTTVLSQAGR